jgi:hypothetical protein
LPRDAWHTGAGLQPSVEARFRAAIRGAGAAAQVRIDDADVEVRRRVEPIAVARPAVDQEFVVCLG